MLSKRDAHKLLRSVQFPGEETYVRDIKLASSSKAHRRKLIRQEGLSDEKMAAAAIELQRLWRGFVTRCLLFSILNPNLSTHAHQTGSRFQHSEKGLRDVLSSPSKSPAKKSSKHVSIVSPVSKTPSRKQLNSREKARARLQAYYQKYWEKGGAQSISFEEFCAHFIQNWWHRIHKARKTSSTEIKSTPSGVKSVTIEVSPEHSRHRYKPKKKKRTYPLDKEEAASIIQGAWRRHIDQQVYKYYRDLINFHCRGDPSMMLRCINPREAKMLDAAGGIHIKFRLAGDRFPPNIYYKIFTHRNIVDMCANSPKDYTRSGAKRLAAKEVHNRIGDGAKRGQCNGDKIGWYERIENNGWRLVSDRIIIRADQDPVTWETSRKKVDFSHSKLKRREDVEKRKRQKKMHWLKKMYQEGMLKSKIGDAKTDKLIEGATAGMVAAVDNEGLDAVKDWEVDELLNWTNGLNFDDYLDEWKGIGTSSGSETFIDEKLHFKTTPQDPFEFALDVPRPQTDTRTDNS